MEDTNNPTQGTVESQSIGGLGDVGQSMTEAEANAGLDAFAAQFVGLEPQEEQGSDSEVATQSEESEETQEHSEDADIETPDEAEDNDDIEESGLDEGEEFVAYDEFKDTILEIGGKHYTGAQLKSMLGRMESVGNDARKADQANKDLADREAKLKEQEAWINSRQSAVQQSDQLAEMQSEARKINAAIEKARSEHDMYEVAVQKDKLEVLAGKYKQTEAQVQQVQSQVEAKKLQSAEKGLRDRGLAYLLENNPQAAAWTAYANQHLSQEDIQTALTTPAIAEALEKARKYDAANAKSGKKLKSSGKTLKPGVNKPQSVNTDAKKKANYQANPDAYFQDLAKEVLKR